MAKKIILLFLICFLFFTPAIIFAELDCPLGLINDPYPGECSRYVDINNDGICDHSQEISENPEVDQKLNSDEVSEDQKKENNEQSDSSLQIAKGGNQYQGKHFEDHYNFIPITIATILIYFFSVILYRKKIISLVLHRKIWNFILLISFLLSGITALFWLFRLNLNLLHSNLVFWHIETSLIMIIVGFFHFIWHWTYYFSSLKE